MGLMDQPQRAVVCSIYHSHRLLGSVVFLLRVRRGFVTPFVTGKSEKIASVCKGLLRCVGCTPLGRCRLPELTYPSSPVQKNGARLLSYTGPRPNRTRGLVRHAILIKLAACQENSLGFPSAEGAIGCFLCISFDNTVHFLGHFCLCFAVNKPYLTPYRPIHYMNLVGKIENYLNTAPTDSAEWPVGPIPETRRRAQT